MRFSGIPVLLSFASLFFPAYGYPFSRFVVYLDPEHRDAPPKRAYTTYITHAITTFASSSHFASDPPGRYEPFMPVSKVRSLFFPRINVCMAIGGKGDSDGFSKGAATNASRALFAKNVAATVDRLGYDCVDIHWLHPGGNSAGSRSAAEIEAFPLLLAEIKKALGKKQLSVTVPGLERDMAAYSPENVKKLDGIANFFNLMAFDLVDLHNRMTGHHTSIRGSMAVVKNYIKRGMTPSKMNLVLSFHARWFVNVAGNVCEDVVGIDRWFSHKYRSCRTVHLVDEHGRETGMTGTMAFDRKSFLRVPDHLNQIPPNGTCGIGTKFRCPGTLCCSAEGTCGREAFHCGVGCQAGFGYCEGPSLRESFREALLNKHYDWRNGGKWYWDSNRNIWWSWDTAFNIRRKWKRVVRAEGLGGVSIWTLGQDSHNWHRLRAISRKLRSVIRPEA